jgi:transcriptional regulator with XRE-family HTH domain
MVFSMVCERPSQNQNSTQAMIGKRIRAARLRKGWNQCELAARSGVSRTTLFQMERGAIPSPRAATLHRLAQALDLPTTLLSPDDLSDAECLSRPTGLLSVNSAPFDRQTNPYVDVVAAQFPELFAGFTPEDWDELYSSFGTGGALTEEGVLQAAKTIAKKRETLRRLSIVLETHLGEAAMAMVDSLYQLVDASRHDPQRPTTR